MQSRVVLDPCILLWRGLEARSSIDCWKWGRDTGRRRVPLDLGFRHSPEACATGASTGEERRGRPRNTPHKDRSALRRPARALPSSGRRAAGTRHGRRDSRARNVSAEKLARGKADDPGLAGCRLQRPWTVAWGCATSMAQGARPTGSDHRSGARGCVAGYVPRRVSVIRSRVSGHGEPPDRGGADRPPRADASRNETPATKHHGWTRRVECHGVEQQFRPITTDRSAVAAAMHFPGCHEASTRPAEPTDES